jgi:molybdenum cofactor cytidylyltransferase
MSAERPAAPARPIAGILLAAGLSSRMGGSNKMLLDLKGESVLRRAARQALAGGLDSLVVVLGHQADRAEQELAGLPCRTVRNPDYELGITTSLQAGVAAAAAAHAPAPGVPAAAVVVMLADMPFVTAGMVRGLAERYRATGAALVISDYDGVEAPPMLYDRALFAEILAMARDAPTGCGKQVVKRHRAEAEVLHWPAAALADLDVPADYERLRQPAPPGGGRAAPGAGG